MWVPKENTYRRRENMQSLHGKLPGGKQTHNLLAVIQQRHGIMWNYDSLFSFNPKDWKVRNAINLF